MVVLFTAATDAVGVGVLYGLWFITSQAHVFQVTMAVWFAATGRIDVWHALLVAVLANGHIGVKLLL